jgi:hypothetical protein
MTMSECYHCDNCGEEIHALVQDLPVICCLCERAREWAEEQAAIDLPDSCIIRDRHGNALEGPPW